MARDPLAPLERRIGIIGVEAIERKRGHGSFREHNKELEFLDDIHLSHVF
jgi:hypothetical protein